MQLVNNLPNLPKWLNIGLAFPIILLNGWLLIQFINYFQPLVSVISVAILLSFVLDYPIKLLQKRGVPRILAAIVVLLLSIIILGAVGVILLPLYPNPGICYNMTYRVFARFDFLQFPRSI